MGNTIKIWKEINGYNGKYLISNTGFVYSRKTSKGLSIRIDKHGYRVINLWKNNIGHTAFIHRLIAQAFISNPLNLPEVDHKDRNKLNNSIDNLRWVTKRINSINQSERSHNTSGKTGVYWYKRDNAWIAQIRINKKTIHLAYTKSYEEACNIRENAELKYYGEIQNKFTHDSIFLTTRI